LRETATNLLEAREGGEDDLNLTDVVFDAHEARYLVIEAQVEHDTLSQPPTTPPSELSEQRQTYIRGGESTVN
jgi:hypothetical protein